MRVTIATGDALATIRNAGAGAGSAVAADGASNAESSASPATSFGMNLGVGIGSKRPSEDPLDRASRRFPE